MRKMMFLLSLITVLAVPIRAQDADCSVEAIGEQVKAAIETYGAAEADDVEGAVANVESLITELQGVADTCADADSSADADSGGDAETSSTASDDPGSGTIGDPFSFNQPHVVEGVRVTVTGIIRPADRIIRNENMFNERPDDGEEYAIIFVTIECTDSRDGTCEAQTWNFQLVGSEGTIYDSPFVVYDDIIDVELLPGGSGEGGVPFLISADDSDLKLIYYPDSIFNNRSRAFFQAEPSLDSGIQISATGSINVRTGPSTNFGVAGTLQSGESVVAFGRNGDGTWLQISTGWVFTELMAVNGDVMSLPVTSE